MNKNLNNIPKKHVIKDDVAKALSVPKAFIIRNKIAKITTNKTIPKPP